VFLDAFQEVVSAYSEPVDPAVDASVRWTEEDAYGVAWWDTDEERFDLLLGGEEAAVTEAAEAAGAP
jgi:hypothetical protein